MTWSRSSEIKGGGGGGLTGIPSSANEVLTCPEGPSIQVEQYGHDNDTHLGTISGKIGGVARLGLIQIMECRAPLADIPHLHCHHRLQ